MNLISRLSSSAPSSRWSDRDSDGFQVPADGLWVDAVVLAEFREGVAGTVELGCFVDLGRNRDRLLLHNAPRRRLPVGR